MHKLSLAPMMLLLPAAASANPHTAGFFIANFDHILGTSLTIKVTAPSQAIARLAEKTILGEINRLDAVLSSFRPDSEFRQWLAAPLQEAVSVSEDLFNVLAQFDFWQKQTQGAINAGTEYISRHWNHGTENKPTAAELQEAVGLVSQKHWELNAGKQTATRLTEVPLRLHTFAKSYVLDKASAAGLNVPGVNGLVLNSGGDILVRGNWQENIAVANPHADAENAAPLAWMQVQNMAVATSGDYRRKVKMGTEWASHIMDPRTGFPAREVSSATVLHPNPVTAGALATAFNVLNTSEREALAAQTPGTEYLVVTREGESITSKGWPGAAPVSTQTPPTTAHLLSVPAKDKAWNKKEELLITFELAKIEGRYYRPFVAVWIEDETGKPVRQIALWYNKPKWLRNLRQWNKLQTEDAASVTSATRSPGEYTLVWDGKDDKGKPVKQGNYTILIEVTRESGTYQIIRETMEFKGKTKKQTLKGNVEITAATLDYRQKPKTK